MEHSEIYTFQISTAESDDLLKELVLFHPFPSFFCVYSVPMSRCLRMPVVSNSFKVISFYLGDAEAVTGKH